VTRKSARGHSKNIRTSSCKESREALEQPGETLRALFFGSDEFALDSLELLMESRHPLVGVVGKPDRPAGRGLRPFPTAVVEKARGMPLDVWQPESLDEAELSGIVKERQWDVGVVVAYGGLIPVWLLSLPPFGFVNVHPSLLPRYRGAAPVERAIMNGASITGVTTIKMNERLDAGDILLHREERIYDDDTAATLRQRLARTGASLLLDTLDGLEDGSIEGVLQEEDKATEAPPIRSEEGNIDWREPEESLDRLVRALNPEPGAYTFFRGKRIKIWLTRVTDVPQGNEPGTIQNTGKEGFLVNTGTSCLQPILLQPEGKSRMGDAEFSRGQRITSGESFTREP
jgi:methionyl-tRNA formyltransferase